mmetsp:Transcript_17944/g.30530  ORF Transcript_17944/g.30530 Transcript_17944/m.30530 type:complete len:88 (-) Transcript_17944:55-318(-)
MEEWQSVVGITEQILDERMAPNNVKALYFRAFALLKLEDFDEAVNWAQKLLVVDPNHAEGKTLLVKAKKMRQDFRDREGRKFAKLFK